MKNKPVYTRVWKSFFHMLIQSKLPYMLMVLALTINIGKSYVSLRIPEYLSGLLTEVTQSGMLRLFFYGLAMIILTIAALAVKMIAQMIIDRNLQMIAVDKILRMKLSDIERCDPREMISRVTTDTSLMSDLLLTIAIEEIPRIYYMVGALYRVFANYDSRLGWIMLLSIPVTLFGSRIAGIFAFGRQDSFQSAISYQTARLGEKLNNIPVIKLYNREKEEGEDGENVLLILEKARKELATVDMLNNSFTSLITLIPTIGVIAIGAVLVLHGQVETSAFVAYYALAGTFITYVVAHMSLWISIKKAQGAAYRVSQILETEDEEQETRPVKSIPASGDIEFRDVCISFGENAVLKNVTFTLKAGMKTALVGYSGSGKSTVLNLIEQFYRPDSGEITLADKPISGMDIREYRNRFMYVSQNAPGFSGSVRELLNYGAETPFRDEKLWEILRQADAAEFVEKLGGLDYEIGNQAEKLSGGQKQKLSICRALLYAQDILLLDEATSALDVDSTERAQQLLDEKMAGKTMILVAHDIRTVRNADKIIVFSEGRVIDQGKHEELYMRCPLYRELSGKSAEGGAA